jgi:NAD(P)-dependent dehydrogenase (short-subunit alcohol dehydrogenase family)
MSFLEERAALAGRVAAVIGGGGGLGQAIALDLARAGVDLALADRDSDALVATATQATDAGVRVFATAFDARDPERLTTFFGDVGREYEHVDILVNVVGGTFHQRFEDSTPNGWDALIRTNFVWLLRSTQLAIPRLRASGRGGSIINLTSIEAHRGAPEIAVYAAMKAAITSFTRSLALELAPEGIRVNAIAPDMTPTTAMSGIFGPDPERSPWGEDAAGRLGIEIAIPMGRVGRYEDVGNCALFLASELSSYVTGQTLHPDGGALASSGWFNWPSTGYLNLPPQTVNRFLAGEDQ